MRKTHLVIAAVMAYGTMAMSAEETFMGLKFRTMTGFQSSAGMRNGFGVGVNYAHKVGPGSINVELGYTYYKGRGHRESIEKNPFSLTDADSVNYQKDSSDGFALRAGWSQEFVTNWSWQAGVSIDRLKNHHEAIGTFGATDKGTGQYGAWTLPIDKSWVTVSPFIGVKWDVSDMAAIEVNIVSQALKVTTVTPVYDSAAAGMSRVTPLIGSKSINKPKLELTYVLKF